MPVRDPRLDALQAAMAARPPRVPERDPALPAAAVALLLRPGTGGLELLLIRRADREGDPWSGHMALPGGRAQAEDPSPEATAARETREEVGIDVRTRGRLLGPLDAVLPQSARAPAIAVSSFVFAVAPGVEAVPNHEVREAIWVGVDELLEPGAATEYLHRMHDGTTLRFPAFGARGNVVWGLTHRILTGFLALYEQAMDAYSLEDGRPGSDWR